MPFVTMRSSGGAGLDVCALVGLREMRYLAVVVSGYAVDLGVSFFVSEKLGTGLLIAAIIGFTAALTVNFLLLELWVFGTGQPGAVGRLAKYVVVASVTLLIRAVLIAALQPFAWSELSRMAVLVLAAGVSLVANYLLTRFGVFRPLKPVS